MHKPPLQERLAKTTNKIKQETQIKVEETFRTVLNLREESTIFKAGLLIALGTVAWLLLNFIWNPDTAQFLVGMTATNILFGRAAGMSFGYTAGLNHLTVIPLNMIVESTLVLLFYPIFVYSWQHVTEVKGFSKIINHTRTAADKHSDFIKRYGIWGLLAFVFIPFWMTGPVVGCAIGYLIDLKPRTTLTTVLGGTFVAILAWAILLRELHDRIAAYSPSGPVMLLGLIVLVAVAGKLLHRQQKKKRGGHTCPP